MKATKTIAKRGDLILAFYRAPSFLKDSYLSLECYPIDTKYSVYYHYNELIEGMSGPWHSRVFVT